MKQRLPEQAGRPGKPAPIDVFSRVLVQLCVGAGEDMQPHGEPWKGTVVPNPDAYADDPGLVNIMPDEPRGDQGPGFATRHPRLYPVVPTKYPVEGGQFVEVQCVLSLLVEPPNNPEQASGK